MRIELTGKVALVTGASKGIGRAIAIQLAACGARVAVNYLNSRDKAEEVVREINQNGGTAAAFQADVSRADEVETLIGNVRAAFGSDIDILINNAGHLVQRSSISEMNEELYNRVMDVNLKSTVWVSKMVIPGMKKKGGGTIVNMTSLAAHNGGGTGASIYAASKAAVLAFTKGLAKELAPDSIRVNAVSPGFIGGTDFHATFTSPEARKATIASIPMKREGLPEDVASVVLFLASDLSAYLTGETIEINGGQFMK